jgi:hypothetical protein
MHGNVENCIENVFLKTNCSDHLEDVFTDRKLILKLILNRCDIADRIHLAQDKGHFWAFVPAVKNLIVHKRQGVS